MPSLKYRRTTRRTVSMRAETYFRLYDYAKEHGVKLAKLVNDLCNEALDAHEAPRVDRQQALRRLHARAGRPDHSKHTEDVERLRREAFG